MFIKNKERKFRNLLPGITMKPLVFEQKTLLCEFRLEKGAIIPPHHHPYEQTGYLISGKVNFRIGDTWNHALSGDAWCIPENIEHEVEILENSVIIEVFSPIRPDYLPQVD